MDSQIVRWFYTIAAILVVGALGLALMELIRINWDRIGRTFIRINIRTPVGRIEHYLAKRDMETLDVTTKDGRTFNYIIQKEATYDDDFPQSMPSWWRSRIPTLDFYEGFTYPLFGRNIDVTKEMNKLPAGDPRYIALLGDKRNLEAQQKQLAEAAGGGKSPLLPTVTLILAIAATVFAMGGAYFGYQSTITITDIGIRLGVIQPPGAEVPQSVPKVK